MSRNLATVGLVGRDREIAELRAAIEHDRPMLVTGEAGIGKTSVVRAAVDGRDREVRIGGAFATLSWMPLFALERALGRRLQGDAAWVASTVESMVGPDLLFVDDLQWADAATLGVLAELAGRVAMVVTARTGSPAARDVVERLTGAGFGVLDLAPLAAPDGAAVALAARSDLGVEQAMAVATRGGGNPFVIEQLAAGGAASMSLRRTIARRLEALSGEARAGLAVLGIASRPVPIGAVDGADELIAAGLVTALAGELVIRHALLAEEVAANADATATRLAHARLAEIAADPGERARHLAGAGEDAAAHLLALEAAASAATPGERAAHLGVAASTATGADADSLRLDAAAALRVAGDLGGAIAAIDAIEGQDPELRARAAAIRARVEWSRGDPDAMRVAIRQGLDLVDGRATDGPRPRSVAEALLRAEAITVTALVDGHFDEGLRDADAALQLAREAHADPTRALLLRATILAGLGRAGWDEALAAVVAAAREAGDVETELSAANNLVTGQEMHGNPKAGRDLAESMVTRAHALRLGAWERQFGAMLASLDLHAGRLRAALDRANMLREEALDPLAEQQVGLTAALALVDLGRPDDALPLLEELLAVAAPDVTGDGDVRYVLAEAAFWAGRPVDALEKLGPYRRYEASEYPTSFLVDVSAAWAALEAGRPIPGPLARGEPVGMLVGASLERAGLDMLAERDPAAPGTLRAAAGAYRGFHRRGELRAGWAAAEATRAAGADAAAVVPELEALESAALADGFTALLRRIQRSLRLAGVRRATRAPTLHRADLLTPRERQLADLVGRGLTNAEIARRMGLGRPTVARLLSNAMGKLGAGSRAQLAGRLEDLV